MNPWLVAEYAQCRRVFSSINIYRDCPLLLRQCGAVLIGYGV